LHTLEVLSNQLVALPSEIDRITNLQWLFLDNNKLANLPPENGRITNLKRLYLYNNHLKTLPPEMRQLVNLEYIDLQGNNFDSHTLDQIKALFPLNCCIDFFPQRKKNF